MNNNNKNANQTLISARVRRWMIISAIVTSFGAFLYYTFPNFINETLRSEFQIKEGNDFTKIWSKNPIPIRFDTYVFSIENAEEFTKGAKAKLKEMGPYTYDFNIYKNIISFTPDQRKVKFWDSQSFHFNADLSVGHLSDKVKVLNFPVFAMANLLKDLISRIPGSFAISPIALGLANILFMSHSESFIKETTVGELLNGFPFTILDTIDTLTKPLTWLGIQLPDTGMPDNKFGFLWIKNYTRGGPYEAYTGQGNTQLLRILTYKDKSELDFYSDSRCNLINGTEGSTLGVDVKKDKRYYLFTADTCKTFNVIFEKNTWVNGIPTYRFIPNPKLFASPSKNSDNTCFCHTPENEEMCDGVFDLSKCLGGAPILYSFPHFLYASMAIRNNVDGMEPDLVKHQPFLDVEPFTGGLIRAAEKIQMNGMIKPIPYLAGFGSVRETILPLIWFEKKVVIDDKLTLQLRIGIWPLYVIQFLIYLCFFGGAIMLISLSASVIKKQSESQANTIQTINVPRSESKEPLKNSFNAASSNNSSTTALAINSDNLNYIKQLPPSNDSIYWRIQPEMANLDGTSQHRMNMMQRRQAMSNIEQINQKMVFNPSASRQSKRSIPQPISMMAKNKSEQFLNSGRSLLSRENSIKTQSQGQQYRESNQKKYDHLDSSVSNMQPNIPNNNDNMGIYWTSINDVVINPNQANRANAQQMGASRLPPQSPQLKKSSQVPIDRITWSPPGSVD